MLIRRSFVAIDRQPLMDDLAVQIELLAKGLHDELLQVTRQEQEPILVGQHDHVLRPASLARVMPCERQEQGRVFVWIVRPRGRVHFAGATQKRVDVDPLKRGRAGHNFA